MLGEHNLSLVLLILGIPSIVLFVSRQDMWYGASLCSGWGIAQGIWKCVVGTVIGAHEGGCGRDLRHVCLEVISMASGRGMMLGRGNGPGNWDLVRGLS